MNGRIANPYRVVVVRIARFKYETYVSDSNGKRCNYGLLPVTLVVFGENTVRPELTLLNNYSNGTKKKLFPRSFPPFYVNTADTITLIKFYFLKFSNIYSKRVRIILVSHIKSWKVIVFTIIQSCSLFSLISLVHTSQSMTCLYKPLGKIRVAPHQNPFL